MKQRQNTRQIGAAFEDLAVKYLISQGYQMVERNFRCRLGEIDIIATDGEYICFIEVKYRWNQSVGAAVDAVNAIKQRKIVRVANYYLMKHGKSEWTPCRFDVAAIDGDQITLYKNAFEAR